MLAVQSPLTKPTGSHRTSCAVSRPDSTTGTSPPVSTRTVPRASARLPSPSDFGRSVFAPPVGARVAAAYASSSPVPTAMGSVSAAGRAVTRNDCLIASGVARGCACTARAAAPDTIAADIDVPLPCRYAPSMVAGKLASIALPGARRDTMWAPGATRSGFAQPSVAVGPRELKVGSRSSATFAVPRSSTAPTVTTHGSSPGFEIVCRFGPRLLAATTTTMPLCHARSTA